MEQLLAWQKAIFQRYFLLFYASGISFALAIAHYSSIILAYIQSRQGVVLDDFLLKLIPTADFSNIVFYVLYFQIFWIIIRSFSTPQLNLQLMWGFCIFYTLRFITIFFVPLEPPVGIINLIDPFAKKVIYDQVLINKDLFFSGHAGFAFFIFLLLPTKKEKLMGLVSFIIISVLILVQHVHYTIDVMVAPFFAYLSYYLSKKMVNFVFKTKQNSPIIG